MQIGLAIETLDTIAHQIRGWNLPERLGAYGAFVGIDQALREKAIRNKLGSKHLEELRRYRWSIEKLCGLSTGNGHDEGQHISWMMGAVDGLQSDHCFARHLDDPE